MVHLCLDFEGVLIPEIWQCLAKEVNSDDLMLTTQDLKDYDELMSCLLYTSDAADDC